LVSASHLTGEAAEVQHESEVSFLERSCRLLFALSGMNLTDAMAINVRRTRHAGNMTQEELADRAGLSSRYLGSIERAEVSATIAVLEKLAKALGVDPGELLRLPSRRTRRRSD
jgi:ribosome-binding protein aMBF1 (putative translation factor)